MFNPEYWCDSECETRTLIDFSGQPELDINVSPPTPTSTYTYTHTLSCYRCDIIRIYFTGSCLCIKRILGDTKACGSVSAAVKVAHQLALQMYIINCMISLAVIYIQSEATRQDKQSGLKYVNITVIFINV